MDCDADGKQELLSGKRDCKLRGTEQNLSVLRESERRYRELVESINSIIMRWTPDGIVTFVNEFGLKFFGYEKHEMVGRHVMDTIVPETEITGRDLRPLMSAICRDPNSFERNVNENRLRDGTHVWIDWTNKVVLDAEGRVEEILGIGNDITEHRRAQEALCVKNKELQSMTQQLWQSAKLATMGELAASIAHELNNPLSTIALRVESLLDQVGSDEKARHALTIIDQEIDRMADLVANLLQFSRLGHAHVSTLDVRVEIDKTLELIHYHLRKRGVRVVREFGADVPMVPADRQRLRQVFLNLFTNAADAMPEGGAMTIRVSARESMTIEVEDTGTGIPPENLARVMDPFFTTKPEGTGTGLGLPICRRIVRDRGGEMAISSEIGTILAVEQ